ncbi:hypothetical protein, partial [Trueperella pyogenes]|uniref:hypothetical protein n=1 Tax=Trueperella pyogenes TaxID=1661 RepID=UPI00345C8317
DSSAARQFGKSWFGGVSLHYSSQTGGRTKAKTGWCRCHQDSLIPTRFDIRSMLFRMGNIE